MLGESHPAKPAAGVAAFGPALADLYIDEAGRPVRALDGARGAAAVREDGGPSNAGAPALQLRAGVAGAHLAFTMIPIRRDRRVSLSCGRAGLKRRPPPRRLPQRRRQSQTARLSASPHRLTTGLSSPDTFVANPTVQNKRASASATRSSSVSSAAVNAPGVSLSISIWPNIWSP